MWERWRKGESLQQIAQLFDRNHSSIQRILAETGGISPAPRHRSILALILAEREEISRALRGFNRSTQQVGEIVVRVFHSLRFFLGVHSIGVRRRGGKLSVEPDRV